MTAFLTLKIATALGGIAPAQLLEAANEASRLALDWFENGGPDGALEEAVAHARAGASEATGSARFKLRNTLARALSALARLNEDPGIEEEALQLWRQLVPEADRLASEQGQASQRLNLASELGILGDSRGDLSMIEEALEILAAVEAMPVDANLQVAVSRANRLRARYAITGAESDLNESIACAEAAVELAADEGPAVRGRAINNLGVKLRVRYRDFGRDGDVERSIRLHREALELCPDGWHEWRTWEANLGHAYKERGETTGDPDDLAEASRIARRVLESCPPGTAPYWDQANNYLASAAAREDLNREEIDELLELGDELLAQPAASAARQRRLGNVAALYAMRCELTDSITDGRRALVLWEEAVGLASDGSPDHLGLLSSLGSGLMLVGETIGDADLLARSVEAQRLVHETVRERGGGGPSASIALSNYSHALAIHGQATLDLDELGQAAAAAREALEITPVGPRALVAAAALGNALLSGIELQASLEGVSDRRMISECLEAYRSAVSMLPPKDPRYDPQAGNLANALFQIGMLTGNLEMVNEATDWYVKATSREGSPGLALRLTNLAMAALTVAGQERDRDRREEQLELAETAIEDAEKGLLPEQRSLRLHLAVSRVQLASARDRPAQTVAAAETTVEIGAEMADTHPDYRESRLRPSAGVPALGALAYLREQGEAGAVGYLERSRSLLLRLALREGREGSRVAAPLDLAQVQLLAKDLGEPIVYLVPGPDGGAMIVCSADRLRTVHRERMSEVNARIAARRLRHLAAASRDRSTREALAAAVEDVAYEIGDWLGDSLAEELSASGRITLIPVGDLAHLPWSGAMLHEEGRFRPLISRGTVRFATSATLLRAASGRGRDEVRSAAVAAVAERTDVPRLRHARREAESIAAALRDHDIDTRDLFRADATVGALAAAAPGAGVLHLSCHSAEMGRASQSLLLLADGEVDAPSLATLAAQAQLLFLAACSTGRTEIGLGDEGISIASLALAAGARSTVSTLWPVDDEATAHLARDFYRAWLAGADAPTSLRHAQLNLADPDCHSPWLWAGFQASGAG